MKLPDLKNLAGLQSNFILKRLGIQPHLALAVVLIDVFLCGGEAATIGLSIPIAIFVGVLLAIVSFVVQRKAHHDSFFKAFFKAIGIGVITAIPTPITPILVVIGSILPKLDSTPQQEEQSGEKEMKRAKGSVVDP